MRASNRPGRSSQSCATPRRTRPASVRWLDGRSGLARTALIPFDDDEVILEEPVEPDSRHLGLTRTAVQLQQDRALGAPASHQQPLPYAPKRQWLESRNAPGDGSPLRIAYRPCPPRPS